MSFKIRCTCNRVLVVPERREGTRVKCPECGSKLMVEKKAAITVDKPPLPKKRKLRKVVEDQQPSPSHAAVNASPPPRPAATESNVADTAPDPAASERPRQPQRVPQRQQRQRKQPPRLPRSQHSAPSKRPPAAATTTAAEAGQVDEPVRQKSESSQDPPPLSSLPEGSGEEPSDVAASVSAASVTAEPRPVATETALEIPHAPSQLKEAATEPSTFAAPASGSDHVAEPDESPPQRRKRGVMWDKPRREIAGYVAWGLLAVACCSIIPACFDIKAHLESPHSPGLSRWAVLLLFGGTLQLAYAGYVLQLRDWSAVWMTAAIALVIATLYAALLALLLLGSRDSAVLQLLDIAGEINTRTAAGWCFIMVCVSGLFSYLAGRSGARWYRVHRTLATPPSA